MNLWWRIGLVALAVVLLLPLLQLYVATHPPRYTGGATPDELGVEHEAVTFETEDGLELAGWFLPSTAPGGTQTAVVVGHGYPAHKGDVLPSVLFLREHHHVLLFDHRSFGESQGDISTVGLREPTDVLAAVDHLLARPEVEHVAGLGFSLSAATMLMAQHPDMEALVAEAGYARLDLLLDQLYPLPWFTDAPLVWMTERYSRLFLGAWPSEVSPEEAIATTRFPVLLIHGTADDTIEPAHAHRLHEAAPEGTSELWLVDGAGHGAVRTVAGQAYEERVLSFLEQTLGA